MDFKDYRTMIVHAGTFHADDVLCIAVAKVLNPDIEVRREFNISDELKNDPEVIICDVGKEYDPDRQLFDHHNKCPEGKAAIGLFIDSGIAGINLTDQYKEILDIIQKIDNGITVDKETTEQKLGDTISQLVDSMNPLWDSKESFDDAFNKAVDFIKENFAGPLVRGEELSNDNIDRINNMHEEKNAEYEQADERAAKIVNGALKDMKDGIVVLPQYAPWDKVLIPSEAKFVIYPSNRGGYNLQCVPPELNSFNKKVELPDWRNGEYLGKTELTEKEKQESAGFVDRAPKGMSFEHFGKSLASFETEQEAVAAAYEALRCDILREEIREVFPTLTSEENINAIAIVADKELLLLDKGFADIETMKNATEKQHEAIRDVINAVSIQQLIYNELKNIDTQIPPEHLQIISDVLKESGQEFLQADETGRKDILSSPDVTKKIEGKVKELEERAQRSEDISQDSGR